MKKILAVILSMTIVMSFTACSGKEEPAPTGSVQTVRTEDITEETEPSATSSVNNPASEYVKDTVYKLKITYEPDPEDGDDEEPDEDELEFHTPQLQIKSSYADTVNKEIASAVEKYKKDLEKEEADHYFGTAYVAYLSKENVLSLLFISYEETDMNEYKVYNIDVKTGEKVDNARIAQIAGVSSIRQEAMNALQNWYNNMEIVKVSNYKVVLKDGQKMDAQLKAVEETFSEKYLNDNMQIGLTNEGKMFFITTVEAMAGADLYQWVFDADGNDIDDEDNPYYVGYIDPEDEDDVDDAPEDYTDD
jgi:hypothetical protein